MVRWWTSSAHLKITFLYSVQSISSLACGTQVQLDLSEQALGSNRLHSIRWISLTDIHLVSQKALMEKMAQVR